MPRPSSLRALGLGLIVVVAAAAAVAQGFVVPSTRLPASSAVGARRASAPIASHQQRGARLPTALGSANPGISAEEIEAKLEGVWDRDVPASIEQVIAQAQASLGAALESGGRRLRVDIRTPGLDEALVSPCTPNRVIH